MQVLASQLHFLANKNAELAIPPLFWPVNCIKIGGHVALLSDSTVYSLYCAFSLVLTSGIRTNKITKDKCSSEVYEDKAERFSFEFTFVPHSLCWFYAWFSYTVIHRNLSPIYCERSLKEKIISEAQKILSTTDQRQ